MPADRHDGIAGRILKANHAGEFGAVNIYRAQIAVARLFRADHRKMLEHFIEHERGIWRYSGASLKEEAFPDAKLSGYVARADMPWVF